MLGQKDCWNQPERCPTCPIKDPTSNCSYYDKHKDEFKQPQGLPEEKLYSFFGDLVKKEKS